MPFEFVKQKIEDVILIKPKIFEDNRGYFTETYKKSDFFNNGIKIEFNQDNFSVSKKYVLRGLHYQTYPFAQAKLIKCLKGEIIDVAVDIRQNSPTFGQYISIQLSQDNGQMLFIPEGFAHGFVVLSDIAYISYKVSKEYNLKADKGIIWNDSSINIDWGIDFEPILSEKDKNLPEFKEIDYKEILQ